MFVCDQDFARKDAVLLRRTVLFQAFQLEREVSALLANLDNSVRGFIGRYFFSDEVCMCKHAVLLRRTAVFRSVSQGAWRELFVFHFCYLGQCVIKTLCLYVTRSLFEVFSFASAHGGFSRG